MLHYVRKGSGSKTLVCLHGFLESSNMWSVLKLEQLYTLVLIDLPGHGKSGLEGIDSMASMAKLVKEVIDNEEIVSYNVLGHSMGGYVALALQEQDTRCENLILLNSNVWTDSESKKEERKRVARLVQTKKDRFVSEAIPNLFQSPEKHISEVQSLIEEAISISSEAIAKASIAMSERYDYSKSVFTGAIPLTVIQGENDSVAPKERMEQVMTNQMDCFYVVSAGHMAHLEATDQVREIILSCCEEVR